MTFRDRLDAALTQVLIQHDMQLGERDKLKTATTWPDQSDIFAATRETIRELCYGQLDPDEYLDGLDAKFISEVVLPARSYRDDPDYIKHRERLAAPYPDHYPEPGPRDIAPEEGQ